MSIQSISFADNGRWLAAAGGGDGRVSIWDVGAGRDYTVLLMDSCTVANSLDDQHIASHDFEGYLNIWDIESGSLVKRLGPGISRAAISRNLIALSPSDGGIEIWSANTSRV